MTVNESKGSSSEGIFTGLDISRAKNDIEEFFTSCQSVSNSFYLATYDLFDKLQMIWASPNAVNFSKEMLPQIIELANNFDTYYFHLIDGAINAATNLAGSHGATFSYCGPLKTTIGETIDNSSNYSGCALRESINNVVGMAVEEVKLVLQQFDNDAKRVIDKLEALPKGIAFYDENGSLVQTYNRNIDSFIREFSELFASIRNRVNQMIETETDNILLAKQQATDTLSA